jgi:peptidoglycan/LPS O-acetylase OafA/YrhL/transcriptional regulator NrdR family protein
MKSLNYRADIDGLRAIAVLSVIIYHARFSFNDYSFMPGGYLGVDVFFVISGYLITSILYQNINSTLNFFLFDFYIRRIRRIFPALIFLLTIITIFSSFIFHNFFLETYSKSAISTLFFVSNLFFWSTGEEYAAFSSLYHPLLHTWSLAVEEQFYLIFPLFIFFTHKFFKKKTIYIVFLTFLISIVGSQIYGKTYASFNFYSLPSRYWEIALGSLIAIINVEFKFERKASFLINSNLGLILILFSFFYYNDNFFHPQIDTSLAVIGTSLIIYSNFKSSVAYKILTSKILVFIGLISYSLYLWHYSIFSIARYISPDEMSFQNKILLIVITFIMSIFSYYYIEQPFRNSKKISKKSLIKIVITTYCVLIFLLFNYLSLGGFVKEKRFLNIENNNEKLRKVWMSQINKNKYTVFEESIKKKILIIGNSHARDLFNSFKLNNELFSEYDFTIFDTQIECFIQNIEKDYQGKCKYLYEKPDLELINNNFLNNFKNADYILISTEWSFNDVLALEDQVIPFLKKNNKKIIITSNSPRFFFNIKSPFTLLDIKLRNIDKNSLNKKIIADLEKLHFRSMTMPMIKLNNWLSEISNRNNVRYLRKENFICKVKNESCYIITDEGYKIFWDNSHFTIEGARFFGDKINKSNWLQLDY